MIDVIRNLIGMFMLIRRVDITKKNLWDLNLKYFEIKLTIIAFSIYLSPQADLRNIDAIEHHPEN